MVDFGQYGPEKYTVCARKCPKCGKLFYPEPMVCRECGTRRDPSGLKFSEWEKVPIGGRCRLLTWTRLFNLPSDFADRFLLFGIVEFDDGLRASGRLVAAQPAEGMLLTARTDVVRGSGEDSQCGLVFEEMAPTAVQLKAKALPPREVGETSGRI